MNVYDFDDTIYYGDSSIDLFFFCLKRNPSIIGKLPLIGWAWAGYKLRRWDKTRMKEMFYSYYRLVPDMQETLKAFWEEKREKIKPWYLEQMKEDDVIISASPYFQLKYICDEIGIKYLIASEVDPATGKYSSPNNLADVKPQRFREQFPDTVIDEFYSDSLSDTPMARLAKKAFIVKGDEKFDWGEYEKSHRR
ncbi:MAG: haloacid dehalogenase-like hydrolase [Eubacteriaceae bacterium]|nr:haloacid dehalogenase-like hydrolase [Eubacteriaceae bacterium]